MSLITETLSLEPLIIIVRVGVPRSNVLTADKSACLASCPDISLNVLQMHCYAVCCSLSDERTGLSCVSFTLWCSQFLL